MGIKLSAQQMANLREENRLGRESTQLGNEETRARMAETIRALAESRAQAQADERGGMLGYQAYGMPNVRQVQTPGAPDMPQIDRQTAVRSILKRNPSITATEMDAALKRLEPLFKKTSEKDSFSPTSWGTILNKATGEERSPQTLSSSQGMSGLTGEEFLKSLPPERANVVKGIAEGRIAYPTGYALKNPAMLKLVSDVQQYNPAASANTIKNLKSFQTGIEGRSVKSFNVATNHLETLDKLSTALQNGDIRAFNAIGNFFARETGRPAPTNFDTAKNVIATEIAKAVGGSSMALADRQEMANTIKSANSPEQLKQAITTYKELMAGQLSGLKTQYEAGTGLTDFDDKFLTDKTRKLLSDIQGGGTPDQMQEGMTATNPQTGEKVIFKNGEWVKQ